MRSRAGPSHSFDGPIDLRWVAERVCPRTIEQKDERNERTRVRVLGGARGRPMLNRLVVDTGQPTIYYRAIWPRLPRFSLC